MVSERKSEWFILDRPFGEPNEKWSAEEKYRIERVVNINGDIIWYGCSVNWKKESNSNWTVLSTNKNAKPLEKYLPEIVYGEDRTIWVECETPIYEKLYQEQTEIKRCTGMRNLANIEVFNIETTERGTFAHISFQDLDNTDNINLSLIHI